MRRLEGLVGHHAGQHAVAVCLTNDPAYWNPPRAADSIDADFRLSEGRTATGSLTWGPGAGTTKGRQATLEIVGSYRLSWRDYAVVAGQ